MDKQKIELSQQKLLLELSLVSTLYKNDRQLSISQIRDVLHNPLYSNEFIRIALQNLVSYGIVAVEFYEKKKTLYQISEFGKYFFEKLLQENSNIKYFSDSIGDIS